MAEGFNDDDLREAAAEAGISPAELRTALAERDGGGTTALVKREQAVPARLDGAVALPPSDAIAAVRGSIERQTGLRGHMQGEAQADIVDDGHGLTWRVHGKSDEGGGALVRIEIDPSAGTGAQKLALGGVIGITTALVGIGALFGALTLVFGGVGVGLLGAVVLGRNALRLAKASRNAEAVAAQALVEAEERGSPKAISGR
jgi:hypothetical protein